MRSIRRSMMIYLLGMLLATLVVIGVVIDQVAESALAAREEAGRELIAHQYEERCQREMEQINEGLLTQARTLYGLMSDISRQSWDTFNLERYLASLMFVNNPFAETSWVATAYWLPPPRIGPGSASAPPPPATPEATRRLAQNYFAVQKLPKEFIQHVSENSMDMTDYQQINDGLGREWHSQSLGDHKFRFDPKEIDSRFPDHGSTPESQPAFDFVYDDAQLGPTGAEDKPVSVHRVILKAPHLGYPIRRGPSGSARGTPNPPRPPQEVNNVPGLPKLYIQCARPKAVIDKKFAGFAEQRDADLDALAQDVRSIRTLMRIRLLAVGLIALGAACAGVWLIVGAGLRPVGQLSAAVGKVSERDFKLPHDGSDLVQELVPIHSRLTQTLDLLRRAFSREKQAVADISHELRTPIAALMATIDVALRKPRTSEQYRTALEDCRQISKQLGQLVERIMTLATLDSGTDRTVVTRTDATDLALGCGTVIRPLAAAGGIELHVHTPAEPLELETDPGKLREVLMNLLHNAVEYNRSEGTIDLTVSRVGAGALFEVRDTGIGMTPEVEEKIFERFYRADPSRHATGIHAGLGLAIVKEYVARLNGTITVESQPGVGTTFRVTFPALPLAESAKPETALAGA